MTQWSEWTRHNGGEKPAHVPDDAEVAIHYWAVTTVCGNKTLATHIYWPNVLMYRYEIKPKVETVTVGATALKADCGEWRVTSNVGYLRPNVRLTFQTKDGVPQWDTLKAEPLK